MPPFQSNTLNLRWNMQESKHEMFKPREWRMIWGFAAALIASPIMVAMLTGAMLPD